MTLYLSLLGKSSIAALQATDPLVGVPSHERSSLQRQDTIYFANDRKGSIVEMSSIVDAASPSSSPLRSLMSAESVTAPIQSTTERIGSPIQEQQQQQQQQQLQQQQQQQEQQQLLQQQQQEQQQLLQQQQLQQHSNYSSCNNSSSSYNSNSSNNYSNQSHSYNDNSHNSVRQHRQRPRQLHQRKLLCGKPCAN
ncbi:hypothetical protein KIN20_028739 [Parelaphostrongylus tenuis]|uniref:Uncharacterized protein n=1 Tax=Parelaphostrongylus tenuis TaxID=148309 RepID=A0AAD5R210_PARTN|nr:hypothetical protein KIN20_028739 [Parelaphostrongylus tenuis]